MNDTQETLKKEGIILVSTIDFTILKRNRSHFCVYVGSISDSIYYKIVNDVSILLYRQRNGIVNLIHETNLSFSTNYVINADKLYVANYKIEGLYLTELTMNGRVVKTVLVDPKIEKYIYIPKLTLYRIFSSNPLSALYITSNDKIGGETLLTRITTNNKEGDVVQAIPVNNASKKESDGGYIAQKFKDVVVCAFRSSCVIARHNQKDNTLTILKITEDLRCVWTNGKELHILVDSELHVFRHTRDISTEVLLPALESAYDGKKK